jgi:hypothetical protein
MSKHTQGQWSVLPEECDKPYIRIRGNRLGGRYKIANVVTPIYDGAGSQEAEETRANARLIAAAPELLEALQEMFAAERANSFEIVGRDTDGHPLNAMGVARKKAIAAIAKATGEQK